MLTTSQHLDRPVRLEVRNGREVVVKTYLRGGAGQVYDDMLALWVSPFGGARVPPVMPEPLSVDPATGEVVMAHVPGLALGLRGDLGDSVIRMPEVAALLADLHSSGASVRRVRSAGRVLASARRKAADLGAAVGGASGDGALLRAADSGDVDVAVAATRVIDLLGACCPAEEDLVPSHGDFSPRNVLGDANGLALIDLDRMQMADPAHDLAYWGAWAWATDALNNQVPSWDGLGLLLHSYQAHLDQAHLDQGHRDDAGGAGEDLASRVDQLSENLAFHQVAALVRIVHGWSSLQDLPSVQYVLLGEAARLLGGRL